MIFVDVVAGVLKLAPFPDKTNNDIQKRVHIVPFQQQWRRI